MSVAQCHRNNGWFFDVVLGVLVFSPVLLTVYGRPNCCLGGGLLLKGTSGRLCFVSEIAV